MRPRTSLTKARRVTSVAWTVADCARLLGRRYALVLADCALHRRMCRLADVQRVAQRLGRAKRIARVRWIIANADPKAESPGESWLRMVVKDLGFFVTSQVWVITDDLWARVDFMRDGTNVVLEFDGLIKYSDEDPDEVQCMITAERRRQAKLEKGGYRVIRFLWEDLFDPETVKVRPRTALG